MLNARLRLATPRRRIDGGNATTANSTGSIWLHPSTGGITTCVRDDI